MLTQTLAIRFGAAPLRPAVAWLISGSQPGIWLAEMAGWQIPLSELALHVIPRAVNNRLPGGLLVIPPPTSQPNGVSPNCRPYGRIAERLYLPVEACLEPEAADAELRELLGSEDAFLFHPVIGLVRIGPAEMLRTGDLIVVPQQRKADWGRAVPGVAFNRRLLSVEPESKPTVEESLETGREGISSERTMLDKLPAAPGEPAWMGPALVAGAGLAAAQAFVKFVHWLARIPPRTSPTPTWINSVENWAQRRLASISKSMLGSRYKELARLLHLLESSPDQGLRFALPLSSPHRRGQGLPGDKLPQRNVDFNLQRLGASKLSDPWDIPSEFRIQLAERYRQLANREIRLGRHRRAAYIFAELLFDLPSAAATLVDGKHYREAAAIYRDRLKQPRDAAKCLLRGGMVSEAIALFEEIKDFEIIGDLYRRLEQHDQARAAWRQSVELHHRGANFLAAARLLEQKLHAPDEAIEILEAGWPDSGQAAGCLREIFQLLGRLGRHDAAGLRIEELRNAATVWRPVALVETLTEVAASYPHEPVASAAADAARVTTARRLPIAFGAEPIQLLDSIARLASEDRLLRRDCQRYLRGNLSATLAPAVRARHVRPELTRISEFQLPQDVSWRNLTSTYETFYALGVREDTLVLIRGRWDGSIQEMRQHPWKLGPRTSTARFLLSADPQETHKLLVHPIGLDESLPLRSFGATDLFPTELMAGSLALEHRTLVALERTIGGLIWALAGMPDLVLYGWGPNGQLISTEHVDGLASSDPSPCLHARGTSIFVGVGDQLSIYQQRHQVRTVETSGVIRGLSGTAPNSRARVAVSLDQGVQVFWLDNMPNPMSSVLADDLAAPLTCFTRGGHLIAASETQCEVYFTQQRRLRFATSLPRNSRPLAVLPTATADRFAICGTGGMVELYQMPFGPGNE